MKNVLLIVIIALIGCVLIMLEGCGVINTKLNMPSRDTIESTLNANKEYFEIIAKFFIDSEYEWCSINEKLSSKIVTSTGESIAPPIEVKNAVSRLNSIGCKLIEMDKVDNSIVFELWSSYQDISCGVLYQLYDYSEPKTEYITELVALEKENERWFYYVSDYNTYRATSAD